MDNIVIFGGTFDPVHNGHLTIAEQIITDVNAQQCIWVPNKIPLLKDNAQATTQQRLDMLSLAIEQSPVRDKFNIDLCEINREVPSYSVDTLRYFRKRLGKQQSISLLMGEDAFVQLNQWHAWETIIQLAHIIIVTRPNQIHSWPRGITTFFNKHHCSDANDLCQQPAGFIYQLNIEMNISSTDIRHYLSQHLPLEAVCPKTVANYILHHGLYT